MEKVSLAQKLGLFAEHWSPKTVATLNDYKVMVVKVKGDFVWHRQDDTQASVHLSRRSAALAARCPHMPWTPPPGGVDDEQRYRFGKGVV
jgi:hypothetical protein